MSLVEDMVNHGSGLDKEVTKGRIDNNAEVPTCGSIEATVSATGGPAISRVCIALSAMNMVKTEAGVDAAAIGLLTIDDGTGPYSEGTYTKSVFRFRRQPKPLRSRAVQPHADTYYRVEAKTRINDEIATVRLIKLNGSLQG